MRVLVTSAPMQVGDTDFGLNDPAKNKKKLRNLQYKGKPLTQEYISLGGDKVPLYYHSTANTGEYYLVEGGYIVYYVKYVLLDILGIRAARQIKVWRDPGSVAAPMKVTKAIFWQELLPKVGVICADELQTSGGKEFWQLRMYESMYWKKHLYVAFLKEGFFLPIKSTAMFNRMRNVIWGEDDTHMNYIPTISQHDLDGTGKVTQESPLEVLQKIKSK